MNSRRKVSLQTLQYQSAGLDGAVRHFNGALAHWLEPVEQVGFFSGVTVFLHLTKRTSVKIDSD